ncbi:MAG: HD domain-containing protein [Bacteroidetes bacterium]|nr:HD domain-containing protein [Bacteroidota bacterium]
MRPNLIRNNKKKIINDPVYGFITIPDELIFDVIEHPYLQRLRRIMQLGLSHLVYPGAIHTRFNHVLGAMHLMSHAIQGIRRKGHEITLEEERAALLAILLHDIGHGPFSHALEYDIVNGVSHEKISGFFIQKLSEEFGDDMKRALLIFQNTYGKPFLHQLVSSQLDMDRLDYLNRDSFYSGVSEGIIGADRLIEMLNVHNGSLVLEEKGIYSIEKFIVARRLMYWQVYLHKTVVSGEFMLIHALRRAKELSLKGVTLFASPALAFFLTKEIQETDFIRNPEVLMHFADLDDYDILGAIKVWQYHDDKILSMLSSAIVHRKLFKIEISREPFSEDRLNSEKEIVKSLLKLNGDQVNYFVYSDILTNKAYNQHRQNINILMKSGEIVDLLEASDNLNISALAQPVEKYFICYPVA